MENTLSMSFLEEAKHYIKNLDLNRIIQKMKKDGWWEEDAREICQQYRNFLFLVKKYGKQYGPFSPTTEIDTFWHHHILDTATYEKDCVAIYGHYLHHDPYERKVKKNNKQDTFDTLQQLHMQEFGEYIYEVRKSKIKMIIKIVKGEL
jgi:hypothetical protein